MFNKQISLYFNYYFFFIIISGVCIECFADKINVFLLEVIIVHVELKILGQLFVIF